MIYLHLRLTGTENGATFCGLKRGRASCLGLRPSSPVEGLPCALNSHNDPGKQILPHPFNRQVNHVSEIRHSARCHRTGICGPGI